MFPVDKSGLPPKATASRVGDDKPKLLNAFQKELAAKLAKGPKAGDSITDKPQEGASAMTKSVFAEAAGGAEKQTPVHAKLPQSKAKGNEESKDIQGQGFLRQGAVRQKKPAISEEVTMRPKNSSRTEDSSASDKRLAGDWTSQIKAPRDHSYQNVSITGGRPFIAGDVEASPYSEARDTFYSEARNTPYSEAGDPFYSEARNTPYSEAGDPFYSEARNTPYSEAGDPFYSEARNTPYSEAGDPFYSEARNTPYSEAGDPLYSEARDPFNDNATRGMTAHQRSNVTSEQLYEEVDMSGTPHMAGDVRDSLSSSVDNLNISSSSHQESEGDYDHLGAHSRPPQRTENIYSKTRGIDFNAGENIYDKARKN